MPSILQQVAGGSRSSQIQPRLTSGIDFQSPVRWILLLVVTSLPTLAFAEQRGALKNSAVEARGVDLFRAIDTADIEVKFIPFDSMTANVLIENKTKEPLKIQLPEAYAAVPILAQLHSSGGQGLGGAFGGITGGEDAFVNVAARKVGRIKATTVCLEHGKPEPNPRMRYEIRPIESFTDKAEVIELCKMLGRRSIDQQSVQAAAWHLTDGMTWEELSRKPGRRHWNGSFEPYFTPQHIAFGARIASEAERLAKSQDVLTHGEQRSLRPHDSSGLFQAGLHQAEEFRQRLLAIDANGVSDAERIGQTLERFLQICPASVKQRANLEDSHISVYSFLQQLRGDGYVDQFGMFEGDTYGFTDSPFHEHHHWHRVETFEPPLQIESTLPGVVAAQYDRTNNGFGWNYLVSPSDYASYRTILGVFYMMDSSDPSSIRLCRPHVGYYGGDGLFVWVSPTEVQIERLAQSASAEPDQIVETGFSYVIRNGRLRNLGRGFQTVYERQPNRLSQRLRFRIDL